MPDRDFWEANLQISPATIRNLVEMCVDGLDVGKADASFAADKDKILSEVAAEFGIVEFNLKIKQPMKERLMEALVFRAVHAKDVQALGVGVFGLQSTFQLSLCLGITSGVCRLRGDNH